MGLRGHGFHLHNLEESQLIGGGPKMGMDTPRGQQSTETLTCSWLGNGDDYIVTGTAISTIRFSKPGIPYTCNHLSAQEYPHEAGYCTKKGTQSHRGYRNDREEDIIGATVSPTGSRS